MKQRKNGIETRRKLFEYLKGNQVTIVPKTFRQICSDTGLSSTSVVEYHLGVLENDGFIVREDGHIKIVGDK